MHKKQSFILATNNDHKLQQFHHWHNDFFDMQLPPSKGELHPNETGNTFFENAFIKAKTFFDYYRQPALADDSGLVISAMPEFLGVKTKEFASHLEAQEKNILILEHLVSLVGQQREAYFKCILCFYCSPEEVFFFEGNLLGRISDRLGPPGGFAQNQIFIPQGQTKTANELEEWMLQHSHRARAFLKAQDFFKGLLYKS